MNDDAINLAIIIASTRKGRRGPTVARWFAGRARAYSGVGIDLIDLADTGIPAVAPDFTDEPPETVRALGERLARAEAFAVVTPEYNHSFPASLKTMIDWYHAEWRAKPVGFVSYGGLAGGLRAVEHLRQVFAELHATTVRDTVSFHNVGERFGDDGEPTDPEGCNAAAKVLLDQLVWWGRALRDARAERPYAV
ncbi:NADPH-dependent FMN reductase [Thermomonospora amylolytica]|uniref:NADPH-dependent FMN reductase n=1 Tax=Thermomonospora amylolytica TaxID=1411117 RepID=UPI000E6C050D|nr:NAD(P)H-dependent oxidoreductase [Thermomonospora amylolytica]